MGAQSLAGLDLDFGCDMDDMAEIDGDRGREEGRRGEGGGGRRRKGRRRGA